MARLPEAKWYLLVRWRGWLEARLKCLQSHSSVTKSQFAKAVNVPASRVNEWLDGSRTVSAQTAFSIGQVLWRLGEGAASGPIALYAAGYCVDFLKFLRQLALYEWPSPGRAAKQAVTLYCAMPGLLTWLDYLCYEFISAKKHSHIPGEIGLGKIPEKIIPVDVYTRIVGLKTIDPSLIEKDSWNHIRSTEVLGQSMGEAGISQLYERAWQSIVNDTTSIEFESPKRGPTVDFASVVVTQLSNAVASDVKTSELEKVVNEILTVYQRVQAIDMASNAISYAEEAKNKFPPMFAPRVWRMMAEWAYMTDPICFREMRDFIPTAYRYFEPELQRPVGTNPNWSLLEELDL